MLENDVKRLIREFCEESHGSTDYDREEIFVKGEGALEFSPLKFLKKKIGVIENEQTLLGQGYVIDSHDFINDPNFAKWFEGQFGRRFERSQARDTLIIHRPNDRTIFDSIEQINSCYDILRHEKIIMNSKNLPIQLGEWYAKTVFGMRQLKTSSQRGFDFFLDGKRVEVTVDWGDASSPKGTKIKKSLVELSDYCVNIYVAKNFMIREICFLDSEYVLRKFGNKGHTLFLKDSDISPYFFSRSSRHFDKIINRSALLKYASPTLAMKLAESFES